MCLPRMNSFPPVQENTSSSAAAAASPADHVGHRQSSIDLHFNSAPSPSVATVAASSAEYRVDSRVKKSSSSSTRKSQARKKLTTTSSSRSVKSTSSSSAGTAENDRPKRPLSAYNIFFQHEREMILKGRDPEDELPGEHDAASNAVLLQKILARSKSNSNKQGPKKKREHVKTHGKIGFVQLAKTVGAKWKKLDSTSRSVYVALATVEKKRYKKEMEIWEKRKAIDAQLEYVNAEKEQLQIASLQFERVMAGSAGASGIFDCPSDDENVIEDMPPPSNQSQQQQQQQQQVSQRMNHAEIMARCRADLATYANSSRTSIGTDVSDLTCAEYHHHETTISATKTTTTAQAATITDEYSATLQHDENSSSSIESLMSDFFDGPDSLDLALDGHSAAFTIDDTMHQTAKRLNGLTMEEKDKHIPTRVPTNVGSKVEPTYYKGNDTPALDAEVHDFLSKSNIGALAEDPREMCKHGQDELQEFLEWAFKNDTSSRSVGAHGVRTDCGILKDML